MGAINDRFRGAVDAAAVPAWELYERGASDADLWAAARKVILRYYDQLLSTADGTSVEDLLRIRIDQLNAARAVSTEACALHATAGLDIAAVLPKELYLRELEWVQRAAALSNRAPSSPVDQRRAMALIQRSAPGFSSEMHEAIRTPRLHTDRPALLCDATIGIHEAVLALPRADRSIALRGLIAIQAH